MPRLPAAAYSTRCHQFHLCCCYCDCRRSMIIKLSLQAYSSGKSNVALAPCTVFRGYVVVVEWLMVMPWFVAIGIPTPRPTSALSRSVKKCDLGARGRKQKKEKRKRRKLRDVTSHIFAQTVHPRCATPTKGVMWGGVPDVINHAKFHQNRFRSFGSMRGRNLPFSYA